MPSYLNIYSLRNDDAVEIRFFLCLLRVRRMRERGEESDGAVQDEGNLNRDTDLF